MISSAADSAQGVSRLAARHIERCVCCRQFHRACRRLDEDLRSKAGRERAALQFAGLASSHPADTPGVYRRPQIRITLAAAACFVVAAAIVRLRTAPTAPAPEPPAAGTHETALSSAGLHIEWPRLPENPLATEVRNLTSDTQSGIRFLAGCLNISPLGPGDDANPHRAETRSP